MALISSGLEALVGWWSFLSSRSNPRSWPGLKPVSFPYIYIYIHTYTHTAFPRYSFPDAIWEVAANQREARPHEVTGAHSVISGAALFYVILGWGAVPPATHTS